jgi:hypothetical protein
MIRRRSLLSLGRSLNKERRGVNCRRVLMIGLILSMIGCASNALSLGADEEISLDLIPPFIQSESLSISVNFPELKHLDELDEEDRQALQVSSNTPIILSSYFGPDVRVISWSFESNFTLNLQLERTEDAPYGEYNVWVEVSNSFGVFTGYGSFFVF